MMRITILSTIILLGWISYSQNPNPNAGLDTFIEAEMNSEKFPGVSTIVVKNGKIIWVESYGLADAENNVPVTDTTCFLLASVSKLFTGTASMQLHEQGITNLDDDINNYLSWPVEIPGFESDSISIR